MSDVLVVSVLIVHFLSYVVAAARLNARFEVEGAPIRISPYLVGPRSITTLWREFLPKRLLRAKDPTLVTAALVHVTTSSVVLLMLVRYIVLDLLT
jgi:hypothetical protein